MLRLDLGLGRRDRIAVLVGGLQCWVCVGGRGSSGRCLLCQCRPFVVGVQLRSCRECRIEGKLTARAGEEKMGVLTGGMLSLLHACCCCAPSTVHVFTASKCSRRRVQSSCLQYEVTHFVPRKHKEGGTGRIFG